MKKTTISLEDGATLELDINFGMESVHESDAVDSLRNTAELFDTQIKRYGVAMEQLTDLYFQVAQRDAAVPFSVESQSLMTASLEGIFHSIDMEVPDYDKAAGVSLEQLEVSMEEISKGLGNAWGRLKSHYIRSMHPLWSLSRINMVRLGSLANKASTKGTVGKVHLPAKYLGDSEHKGLNAYFTDVVKTLEVLVEKFPQQAAMDFKHNRELARNLHVNNVAAYRASAPHLLSEWRDPRKLLSKEQLDLIYPNGSKMFVNESGVYHGNDEIAKKFDELAFQHYPTMIGSSGNHTKGLGSVEVTGLSGQEIRKLAGEFKHALSKVSALESLMEKYSAEFALTGLSAAYTPAGALILILHQMRTAPGISGKLWGEMKDEINSIIRALTTSGRLFVHTSYDASRILLKSSSIFITVSKACMKGVTVSTENISLEGSPFKLRTGMRVKYSGGYGKIVKIFDRPTKYKGEIHHCTKDNPKYEVKSDMGNKLSLHKGSALTPV